MLSIGRLGKGQERYYLDKVAEGAEDYYSGKGEAEGQWLVAPPKHSACPARPKRKAPEARAALAAFATEVAASAPALPRAGE